MPASGTSALVVTGASQPTAASTVSKNVSLKQPLRLQLVRWSAECCFVFACMPDCPVYVAWKGQRLITEFH